MGSLLYRGAFNDSFVHAKRRYCTLARVSHNKIKVTPLSPLVEDYGKAVEDTRVNNIPPIRCIFKCLSGAPFKCSSIDEYSREKELLNKIISCFEATKTCSGDMMILQ